MAANYKQSITKNIKQIGGAYGTFSQSKLFDDSVYNNGAHTFD